MVKMTRSKTFQAYLPSCHRTYSCIHCRAHLANHDELISKVLVSRRPFLPPSKGAFPVPVVTDLQALSYNLGCLHTVFYKEWADLQTVN